MNFDSVPRHSSTESLLIKHAFYSFRNNSSTFSSSSSPFLSPFQFSILFKFLLLRSSILKTVMPDANFASRTIEITVISAENLQLRGNQIKSQSDLFVTVRSDCKSDSVSTKIHRDDARFPQWNEKLHVDLPMCAAFVIVEICRRSASGRKINIVGMARVPVKDFTAGYVPESYLQFLSYRLRDVRGERNGVVNLSVKVKVAAGMEVSLLQKQGIGVTSTAPMAEAKFHGGGGVVVTGIPIWTIGNQDRIKI